MQEKNQTNRKRYETALDKNASVKNKHKKLNWKKH